MKQFAPDGREAPRSVRAFPFCESPAEVRTRTLAGLNPRCATRCLTVSQTALVNTPPEAKGLKPDACPRSKRTNPPSDAAWRASLGWALHVQDDRDRPVVHELDGHRRAEDAARDRHAECLEVSAKAVVERLRLLGRRRLGEAGPVALPSVVLLSDVNCKIGRQA